MEDQDEVASVMSFDVISKKYFDGLILEGVICIVTAEEMTKLRMRSRARLTKG